jgi:hypothetical protein
MEAAMHAVSSDYAVRLGEAEFGHGLRAALAVVRDAVEISPRPSALDLVSPELALVCPELRQQAIEQLPDRDPDGFVPRRRPPEPEVTLTGSDPVKTSFSRLVVGATAYVAVEAGRMAVYGAVAIGATAGVVTLMTIAAGA